MGSVNSRGSKLYLDFRYCGVRCREQTLLTDTAANIRKLTKLMNQIDADIRLGCFVYSEYFPESKNATKFVKADIQSRRKKEELLGAYKTASKGLQGITSISFEEFAHEWFAENEVRWKTSYVNSMKIYLFSYLVNEFGDVNVDQISRPDILKYRAKLMQPKLDGTKLSTDFVNHIMTPLRMILREAADRYGFRCQFENIKPLRVEKRDVNPFTLEEVMDFLNAVKVDYRNYFLVRFFTGMRTSEIDGLKWRYVDFRLGVISVRETYVQGKMDSTKTLGSARDIHMSSMVLEALKSQKEVTGAGEFVFCNAEGNPLDKGNIRDRVWKPTLKKMGLPYRRPYETRHTAATLWLAAGEAPEWIARQMGHSNTKMLFEIYSRYVPNLTRKDGSAFERLLTQMKERNQ
ncbi:Arm DNA-binding domain-containing protein [Vibrio metschnikovii]|uniref:Arm DNA-binding domain-containing protein n=1 Tax=Vibrio metschnikovii TaxID=28172 RepID=UPI002FC6940C